MEPIKHITAEEIAQYGVVAAPDRLIGRPADNKAVFDRLVRELVAVVVNSIIDETNNLLTAEDVRENQEAQRVEAEAGRVREELLRLAAETARAEAEQLRAQVEEARVQAEESRATAEAERVDQEDGRTAAETARVEAEELRDQAEQDRAAAETEREEAEAVRVQAEEARSVFEAYDPEKTYVPGNKVVFGGSSWMAKAQCRGVAPVQGETWLLIARRGLDGEGSGDMLAEDYDPDGLRTDVYAYARQTVTQSLSERTVDGKPLSADVTILPTGGLQGQALVKASADDRAVQWGTCPSNPNLLDNWYFVDPINQRGQTEYTGIGYTIDRWTISGGTLSLDGGLSFDGGSVLQQPMDGINLADGVLRCVSYLDDSKQVYFGPLTKAYTTYGDYAFCYDKGARLYAVKTNPEARKIVAIKLELGPVQTLAHKDADGNWVLNDPPPDKQQELAKCQRYQIELFDKTHNGQAYIALLKTATATETFGLISLPVPMRDGGNPTLITDCSVSTPYSLFGVFDDGFSPNKPVTQISVYSHTQTGVIIKVKGTGFVLGNDYYLYTSNQNRHQFLLDRNL